MIWHYPYAGEKTLAEEEEEEEKNHKAFTTRLKRCNPYYLYPNIFVIDFDHTLAVYDSDQRIPSSSNDQLPSLYTRPFMVEFLQFLKRINKNNILLLWTRAKKLYVSKFVLLLGIGNYFDHILSREDCKSSYKKYKCYKSFRYITDNFPKYSNMRAFLIDNLAYKNGGGGDTRGGYYFRLLSVKPFTLDDVENGSDSALLNLMLYLDEFFFKEPQQLQQPPQEYNVVVVDESSDTLFLGRKVDVSACEILVTGWTNNHAFLDK